MGVPVTAAERDAVVRYLRRVVPRGDAEAAELAALIERLSPSPHPG